ncbi:MAG: hypothetical protein RL324_1948 [Verrucomicrobiota bacterium]
MGIIRFFLAFCVVLGHAGTNHTIGPVLDSWVAVQGFYIISGFYISMVLNTSYSSCLVFWTNRLLRLLPVYYAALLLGLWAYQLGNGVSYWHDFSQLPLAPLAFMFFNQATLIFQDVTLFTGVQQGHFMFMADGSDSTPILRNLLIIPQAWSLGVEVSFYLVAPFIVRKLPLIGALFLGSLVVRMLLIRVGYSGDPWSYRFFPNELALFLLGVMAHKLYARHRPHFERKDWLGWVLLVAMVAYIVAWAHIPLGNDARKICFFLLTAASLPYVFALSKDNALDRFIANLSYPIYVSHYALMTIYDKKIGAYDTLWSQLGLYSMILLVSIALYLAIDWPMDRVRKRIKHFRTRASAIGKES